VKRVDSKWQATVVRHRNMARTAHFLTVAFSTFSKALGFSFLQNSDGLLSPHSHYLVGTRSSLQGVKRTEREPDLHFYLVPRLRKCGNSPPCPLCRHGVHGHDFSLPHLAYKNIQGDTKKTGTFEKPNKNWRNPRKKIYWQKLNHYNLPFKRQ